MSADPSFHMFVQDVFSIAKRGTVVTGQIDAGTLKVGDEIMIRGNGQEKRTVVTGIEAFRKIMKQAGQGENVGVLLKDVTKAEVARGYELLAASSDFSWNT